jgi:hypothetical protein
MDTRRADEIREAVHRRYVNPEALEELSTWLS